MHFRGLTNTISCVIDVSGLPQCDKLGSFSSETDGITVLLMNFNYASFLPHAVLSALQQEIARPLGVLIVDDASTDDSRLVIERLVADNPNQVSAILFHENWYGKGVALFPEIISNIATRFVALLDADDQWTNERKLERQIEALENNNAIVCHHSYWGLHTKGDKCDLMRARPRFQRNWDSYLLTLGDGIATSTSVIDMKKAPKLDRFNLVSWDWAFWSILSQHGKIIAINDAWSIYRVHGQNHWAGADPNRELSESLRVEQFLVQMSVDQKHSAGWKRAVRFRRVEIWCYRKLGPTSARFLRRARSLIIQLRHACSHT